MWHLKWGFRMSTPHGRRKLRLLLQQSCQVKLSLNNDPSQATVKIEMAAKWFQNPGANFQSEEIVGKEHKF
jgi:hypothetical protein